MSRSSLTRLFLVVVAGAIVAALAHLPVELDEAYYWCWSRALGPSYVDHPPGIAWVLRASTAAFGDGWLGLRGPSLLSTLVVGVASFLGARRLSGRPEAGPLALLVLAGAPMIVIGYLPATPDPFQAAVLAIGAYALTRSEAPRWGFIAGLLFVSSVIFKHSSALVAAGVVLGLLRHPEGRARLRPLLLGVGLGLLLLSPWIRADLLAGGSLSFQGHRVFDDRPTRWLSAPVLVLGATLLTFGPGIGIALWSMMAQEVKTPTHPVRSAMASGAGVLLIGCAVAAGLGTGELNWPLPALIVGLPAAVAWALDRPRVVLRLERISLLTAAVGVALLVHIVHPYLPIPPDKDRTLRSAGFDEIAQRAARMAEHTQAQALIARRYQAASMLRYHLEDRIPVLERSTGRPSQFDRWPHPSLCEGEAGILVLNHAGLSEELVGHAVQFGETVVIDRRRGDRVVDQWYVSSVRMIDASMCRGGP